MSTVKRTPTTSTAPRVATVRLTIGGRTWTATAETRDAALVKLARLIEEGNN